MEVPSGAKEEDARLSGMEMMAEFASEVPRMLSGSRRPGQQARGEVISDDDHDCDWVVWSEADVGDWIDLLLGESLGESFRINKVDGPTLLELTDEDLQASLGIMNPLHRQKILGHVRVFQMRRARLAQHAARARRLSGSPNRPTSAQDVHTNGERIARSRDSTPSHTGGYVENGNPMYFAPSSRKKPSRSCGPERLHSSPSSVHGLSRSHTEASSISGDSRRCDDERSGFSSVNRFSRYTNPSRISTQGLSSCFGLDSPSYSVRGSWSTAPSRPQSARLGPGPCTYNVENMENLAVKTTSPRPCIGTSTRDTSEHFVSGGATLGGGKYLSANAGKPKVKGGVIGSSSRWGRSNRLTPGPASYNPRQTFLSTFK